MNESGKEAGKEAIIYDGSTDTHCTNSLELYGDGTVKISKKTIWAGLDIMSARIFRDYVTVTSQLSSYGQCTFIFRKHDDDYWSFERTNDYHIVVNRTMCSYVSHNKQYRLCSISDYLGSYFVFNVPNNPLLHYVSKHKVAAMNDLDIDFGKLLVMPSVNSIFKPFSGYHDIIVQTIE